MEIQEVAIESHYCQKRCGKNKADDRRNFPRRLANRYGAGIIPDE